MDNEAAAKLYADLGARPVINAAGAYTILGGSAPSPAVRQAMEDANRYYVEMRDLLASSGRIIADLLGCEAAYVTSGAAAALALASAACMTGGDGQRIERLPDTTGMPNEVLIQSRLRVRYDRCVTIPGARLVEVGDAEGTTEELLAAAIGPRTSAVHYLAPGGRPGVLPLETVIDVAHAKSVPVIVDAAGQTYPLDNLKKYTRMGADLVCYAGKYFDAPHSTGLVCGRADLVEAAALNGFIGFETSGYLSFGRPMKLDRQEVVAVVVALREWLAMDHEARFIRYGERADHILAAVRDIGGITAYRLSEREPPPPVMREAVRVEFGDGARRSAQEVATAMREGTPSVWVGAQGNALSVSVAFFNDGEEAVVAERLRAALTR